MFEAKTKMLFLCLSSDFRLLLSHINWEAEINSASSDHGEGNQTLWAQLSTGHSVPGQEKVLSLLLSSSDRRILSHLWMETRIFTCIIDVTLKKIKKILFGRYMVIPIGRFPPEVLYNRKIKTFVQKPDSREQGQIYLPHLWAIKGYISLFIKITFKSTNRNMTYNPVEKVEKGYEQAIYRRQYKKLVSMKKMLVFLVKMWFKHWWDFMFIFSEKQN